MPQTSSNRRAPKKSSAQTYPRDRPTKDDSAIASTLSQFSLSPEIQQNILDSFTKCLKDKADPNTLSETIQTLKGHLYRRDFDAAFGEDQLRYAYAARWSAGRAIGYLELLYSLQNAGLLKRSTQSSNGKESLRDELFCIGGGAGAELAAFRTWLDHQDQGLSGNDLGSGGLHVHLLDIADWSNLSATLEKTLSDPLQQQRTSELPFTAKSTQASALTLPPEKIYEYVSRTSMVTLMFTLNELYATDMRETMAFLLAVTMSAAPGTLLLVVDSAGSYAGVTMGSDESENSKVGSNQSGVRRYPMSWMLDHTLLQASAVGSSKLSGGEGQGQWRKLLGVDSRWWRFGKEAREQLKYPLELEDMRYQLHLYQRTESDEE